MQEDGTGRCHVANQCCHEVLSAAVRKIMRRRFCRLFQIFILNEDGGFFLPRRWRLDLMSDAEIGHGVAS